MLPVLIGLHSRGTVSLRAHGPPVLEKAPATGLLWLWESLVEEFYHR